jgi:hypothetical protein
VTDYLLHPDLSCPYNIRKGVTNEPILKIITNHLVLPISYTLDAEIQIPNHGMPTYSDPIKLVWGKDSDDPLPGVFPDFGVKKGASEDAVLFLHVRF